MRKFHNIAIMVICLTMVSACIPIGVNDNRVRGTSSAPQLEGDRNIISQEPDWSPASVDRNASAVTAGEYVVKSGDTLSGIAVQTGSPQNAIADANGLSEPFALRVGQTLQIPGGTYHRVSNGETGIAIARAYGVPWNRVVDINGLEAPYILRVGQRLRLPSSSQKQALANINTTPEQRALGFNLDIDDIVTGGEPAVVEETDDRDIDLASTIPKPTGVNNQFVYPVRGRTISRFGSKGGGIVNDGINIAAENGTAIGAASSGVVVYSGNEIEIFGGLILIDHGGGWVTAYGHIGKINVKRGDKVAAGQNIGEVGETGYVDRPQLHFEIRKDRKPIDPLTKLPNN